MICIPATCGLTHRLAAQAVVEPELGTGFVELQNQRPPHLGRWYLGVSGHYTPSGLYLTQVYPGTAAAHVGLEVRDRIVAVNGRRISMRYPLSLGLQSTYSGWVRLSVRDWRTNQLLDVDVRLTRVRVHF
jgi:S1-C subfamily serine protease